VDPVLERMDLRFNDYTPGTQELSEMKSRVDRTLGKGLRTQILRQTSVTSRHLTSVICFLAARRPTLVQGHHASLVQGRSSTLRVQPQRQSGSAPEGI